MVALSDLSHEILEIILGMYFYGISLFWSSKNYFNRDFEIISILSKLRDFREIKSLFTNNQETKIIDLGALPLPFSDSPWDR